MKVEILDENPEFDGAHGFEKRINEFIKDKQVIDIKYQSNCSGYADSGVHSTDYERSALIMYEDKKETADKPVVEKLKEEKADLSEKIDKLYKFLHDGKNIEKVGFDHAKLMNWQMSHMISYESALEGRIKDLEETE